MQEPTSEAAIDIDVARAAQIMRDIYGANALNIAAQRAHHLFVAGDVQGFDAWAKMMAAIWRPAP